MVCRVCTIRWNPRDVVSGGDLPSDCAVDGMLVIGWRPHLDWGWLKANVSVLDAAISARNMPNLIGLPLKVAKLHDEWLATGKAVEQAEKEHATNGRAIHTSKDESKKDELMARANATKANLHAAQTRSDAVWKALNSEAERLPNLVSPETPIGDESKAKLLGTGGVKRKAKAIALRCAARLFCSVRCPLTHSVFLAF